MDGYAHNDNGVSRFYNCLKGVELSPVGVSGARRFFVLELGRRPECSGGAAGHVINLRGNPLLSLYAERTRLFMRSCSLKMTINNILNNKTYTGRIVHNGMETKGLHGPIVSNRWLNRCNQMLNAK